MKRLAVLAAVCALPLAIVARPASSSASPPPSFVAAALCVHSGWHYSPSWQRGHRPDYALFGHPYWRTYDVPDSWAGGTGEGAWNATSDPRYGGGLSFTVSTWNRAGRPYASSRYDIAAAPAAEQVRRAWLIVSGDGGSWREWPTTSRACGLR